MSDLALDRIIISPVQSRYKDSYASAPGIGLTLRCNGEETTSVIDSAGNVVKAGFVAPTEKPVAVFDVAGNVTDGVYVYAYVYAATARYPLVESPVTAGGSLAPRSNPSPPSDPITLVTSSKVNVTVSTTPRVDITEIWIYRTVAFTTEAEATLAGVAGVLFYIGKIDNDPEVTTVVFNDNLLGVGEQIENDNFAAPTGQFVVFQDPYFWMFGNFPLVVPVSIDENGLMLLLEPNYWFDGRNGHFVKLEGVDLGGVDGFGTYYFKYLNGTSAQLTLDINGTENATVPYNGTTVATIKSYPSTLWRSKPRNPFSWGYSSIIGSALVANEYAFKIGGGIGTGLAVIPDASLLKLDLEQPAMALTLNLKTAGQENFESTLRIVSRKYSASSQATQFISTLETGQVVTWGLDRKNFAILQCDGNFQTPISSPVFKTLRDLTTNLGDKYKSHGVFEPYNELNCIWLQTQGSANSPNLLIFQHSPSGAWGINYEHDLSASAAVEDPTTGETIILGGTEAGHFGKLFAPNIYTNWINPSQKISGEIFAFDLPSLSVSIDPESATLFDITDTGWIGSWVLITDANGDQEQWARVFDLTPTSLFFDIFYIPVQQDAIADFIYVPVVGYKFYAGLTDCSVFKYYDLRTPTTNKGLEETWATLMNVDPNTSTNLLRFFAEFDRTNGVTVAWPQDKRLDGSLSNTFNMKTEIPSDITKSFGLEFIERGYQAWQLVNFTLKYS